MTTKTEFKKSLKFFVPDELHKKFRILCIEEDISINDKLLEVLENYMEE